MAPTPVTNPEWLILDRTVKTLREMAANGNFAASRGEAVFPVHPKAIVPWKTVQGHTHNMSDGLVNMTTPCMLVTVTSVKGSTMGVNCADDEPISIVIQIVDQTNGPQASMTAIRTYGDWMNRIRHTILGDLVLFRQDMDPAIADPYVVYARDRVPSDPQRLWTHEQQVAVFSFMVMVRHHRTA